MNFFEAANIPLQTYSVREIMKKSLMTLALMISCFQVFAQGPSGNEVEFCSDRQDPDFVKELTRDSSNLMSFTNQGGMLGGGVCWWHSRFQRNALYLTIFKPELDMPSDTEVRTIIQQIKAGNKVVVIPGFRNFSEFSYQYATEIQHVLEVWQKVDGIARFAWVKGLKGASQVSPAKLKQIMDKLYEEVEVNQNIAYNKLQIPGIDAHAWLVVHMEKNTDGYDLEILDSNFPSRTEIYNYREGDTSLNYQHYYNFVPYIDQKNEMQNLKKSISKFCKSIK